MIYRVFCFFILASLSCLCLGWFSIQGYSGDFSSIFNILLQYMMLPCFVIFLIVFIKPKTGLLATFVRRGLIDSTANKFLHVVASTVFPAALSLIMIGSIGSMMNATNVHLGQHSTAEVIGTVISKKKGRLGKRTLKIEFENKRISLSVTPQEYDKYREGDDFNAVMHEGSLGFYYYKY